MTRIVAGEAGGRTIKVPPSVTRPTSERVREALFSLLEARFGGPGGWPGKRVLDLYAGSGALALEALSRGAASAVAVEAAPAAARTIKANAVGLGLATRLQVAVSRTEVFLARTGRPGTPFDLVFLDPPYALPAKMADAVLAALAATRSHAGPLERRSWSGQGEAPPTTGRPGPDAEPGAGEASAAADEPDAADGPDAPGKPGTGGPDGRDGLGKDDFSGWAPATWLAEGALIVVERPVRSLPPAWPVGWEDIAARKYGDTVLHLARFLRKADSGQEKQ
jgi:16S rRNA (guanine966-N2)-methyltransferase